MKKFIAAFDGLRYSKNTAAYAINLAKLNEAALTGIFLDDFSRHSYNVYAVMKESGSDFKVEQDRLDAVDADTRKTAVKTFQAACKKEKVACAVRHDKSLALQELLRESTFADLLIIDKSESFAQIEINDLPSEFIRNLLPDVQCPVLIVPREYKPITKVLMLYDGSPSSIFAIKTFSNLLEQIKPAKVEILSVMAAESKPYPDETRLLRGYVEQHFHEVKYTLLNGAPKTRVPRYVNKQKENTVVVAGAYRRGLVSRWLQESMADILMRETMQPIFIAHT